MKHLLVILALLPSIAAADSFVEGGWELLAPVDMERSVVALESGNSDPHQVAILNKPSVSEARYLIAGEVKYADASGYLEMWSIFENGRYFSRTLGEVGPMAKLEGTADWRPFMLPFNSEPGKIPQQLEINVVLPGGGDVELRNVNLYQTSVSLATPSESFWKTNKLPALVLALVVAALAVYFWSRCVRKKRSERELRAMTASDLSS